MCPSRHLSKNDSVNGVGVNEAAGHVCYDLTEAVKRDVMGTKFRLSCGF
jgi:hypothetical protein